jgi:N-acetylglucosaminyldiphosphoundecaprenol N-acetyl-beta-D-mannosaminyltransferase
MRYNFMGCPLDAYTIEAVHAEVKERIECRAGVTLIHFLNVGKIVRARDDKELVQALWDGDMVLADGKPLVPLGRLVGARIPERVNGTDLMLSLLQTAADMGLRVYFLGGTQGVVESCAAKVRSMYPYLAIAGYSHGYFSSAATEEVINRINSAAPDILFVGMGTPQKELFAFRNRRQLKASIVQGVGGSFEVVAGVVKRAPLRMQEWGLEWLFRVFQEPKRMFWRYLSTNSRFIMLYLAYFLESRFRRVMSRKQG